MDFELDSVHVITAILLADLKEEIYDKIRDGCLTQQGKGGKVLRLIKSLYGLKQSPRAWNEALDTYLKSIGFMPTSSEQCIYVGRWQTTTCYILVYVDDMLIAAPNRKIMANIKAKIYSKFPITGNGPLSFWLNMHFIRKQNNENKFYTSRTKDCQAS